MTGLHFRGKENVWYRFYQSNRGIINWKLFITDVITGLESLENRDVHDLLNKLLTTSTVSENQDNLEELRHWWSPKTKDSQRVNCIQYYIVNSTCIASSQIMIKHNYTCGNKVNELTKQSIHKAVFTLIQSNQDIVRGNLEYIRLKESS